MKKRIFAIVIFMIFVYPAFGFGATYNWYFSDDADGNAAGNDTSGDGSIGTPWKSLNKAQAMMLTLGSDDVANIYFDRGDTWDASTPNICSGVLCSAWTTGSFDHVLAIQDGTVHIDAYGTGAKPVLDGGIDFTLGNPITSTRGAEPAISIERPNSSIKNIELKSVQNIGIRLRDSGPNITGVEVANCKVHNCGYSAIQAWPGANTTYYSNTVQNNEAYDLHQILRYFGTGSYAAGISIDAASATGTTFYGNIIRANKIYNQMGEGIIISCGAGPLGTEETIVENNLIADTYRVGLLVHVNGFTAGVGKIRWNKLLTTASGRAIYGSSVAGIRVLHEKVDDPDMTTYGAIEIYGNTVISYQTGISVDLEITTYDDVLGSLKIYNNTLIDNRNSNFYFETNRDTANYVSCVIKNNASIYFNQTGQAHIVEGSNHNYGGVTISDNFFWDKAASSYGSVLESWRTNYATGDPKINGEPTIDWDNLASISTIDFNSHLIPNPGSALTDAAATLGEGYDATFLAIGTDFSTLPDTETFITKEQGDYGSWDFGAVIALGVEPTGTIITGLGGSGVSEGNIVSGLDGSGNPITIILTAVGDTWVATVGADNAISSALLAGITSEQSEAAGWNAEVRDNLVYTNISRDSNTQITITIPATAAYSITANEIITVTVPASAVSSSEEIIASPTLTISNDSPVPSTPTGIGLVHSSAGKAFSLESNGINITVE